MKRRFILIGCLVLVLGADPAQAVQEAILTANSLVAKYRSSIQQYRDYKANQQNAAARELLTSAEVFVCPRDTKVEVIARDAAIAQVRIKRLDANAQPISLYFWTLSGQLRNLPRQ